MAAVFETKLVGQRDIARDTIEFEFEKPDGFVFEAGQSMDVILVDPAETDAEGTSRSFSIASAPHEPRLAIASRMRDTAFKRVLKSLPSGSPVKIEGPFGSFTLHENAARPAIMLAGGIGVTVFHSMIKDATERGVLNPVFLFYSNRTLQDAAYLDELGAMEKLNPNFRLIATMTQALEWEGESGYIDMDMIRRHVPDVSNAIFYVAGPLGMVTGMQKMLRDAGISRDDIRTEEFAGY